MCMDLTTKGGGRGEQVCTCMWYFLIFILCVACENEISCAVTERKQAEMRLKSAQSELKEKEKACKDGETSYSKDKASLNALQKEMTKIEVGRDITYSMNIWLLYLLGKHP